jgi:hypothetical protein
MKKWKMLILVIGSTLAHTISDAQEINTDRPDQTESSSTVPARSLQIESGILVGFSEGSTFSERQILAPTTLLRFGLFRFAEIRMLSQVEHYKSISNNKEQLGISDFEIGTKIQLFRKAESNTELAILSHLVIPSGSTILTNGTEGVINKLSISHAFTEDFGIGYNLGYNYFGAGSGDLTYSLALGYSLSDKVGIYIEPYGELNNMKTYISNFDAGFTYLFSELIQADFSFGTGLNHKMNYASIGLSCLFVRESANQ